MPTYCSFLIFAPKHVTLLEGICAKANWQISFIDDPSDRFRFDDFGGYSQSSRPDSKALIGQLSADSKLGKLLLIRPSDKDADNILQLVGAICTCLNGLPFTSTPLPSSCYELPHKASERQNIFEHVFRTTGYFESFFHWQELPVALALATKVWRCRSTIYAIHKLAQSIEIESISPWSTSPRFGQVFSKHSQLYSSHVQTSKAINLAYSAIEELQLDVRSSSNKPRWLNNKQFKWNPIVLKDIESRLIEKNIDPTLKINWISRGPKSEPVIETPNAFNPPYSDGKLIRDVQLSLPNAIHSCSYIRNFLTAHAFGKDSHLLGPYEVFNVQNVARTLILKTSGFWNIWTRDIENPASGSTSNN